MENSNLWFPHWPIMDAGQKDKESTFSNSLFHVQGEKGKKRKKKKISPGSDCWSELDHPTGEKRRAARVPRRTFGFCLFLPWALCPLITWQRIRFRKHNGTYYCSLKETQFHVSKHRDKVILIQASPLSTDSVLNGIAYFYNVTKLFTFRITAESHKFYGIIIFNLIVCFICHLHCRDLNKIPLGHEINRKPFHAWQKSAALKMEYLDWIISSTNANPKITTKIFIHEDIHKN